MRLKRHLQEGGNLPLTPLIDVMFQILLFYMLTASVAINPALKIDLPEAYTTGTTMDDEIVLSINAEGAVSLGALVVPEDMLVQTIREMAAREGKSSILLLGDASIPYRTLVSVMDKARTAGIQSVSLGTLKASVPPR